MSDRNYEVTETPGKVIKSWTRGVPFEDAARAQLTNIARLPFIFHHVAAMPDVHLGIGATVGSVVATQGAIIPAAVGVDIGCGMQAVETDLTASDLPDNLSEVRSAIEAAIPHGRTDNGGSNDRGAWGDVPEGVTASWCISLANRFERIATNHPGVRHHRPDHHLGTLGTGNHFSEVCLDENNRVWLVLHSGSRGPGNQIGRYFIERAKREMEKWFIHLPDADLAYFPEGSHLFNDYVEAVSWAQDYAKTNRQIMMENALRAVGKTLGRDISTGTTVIDCHHNYVEKEHHFGANVLVTRKGAVRARTTDLGIIPGSMGAKSYIVRGKGNPESFNSCSHGAGRKMSRGEAQRTFSLADHAKATAGVECRKDEGVLDETPGAYKDIDAVMEAQRDLVEVVHTLKQVVCVKG